MEQTSELRNKPIHIESINLRHQSIINVLVRQKFVSFLRYMYYTCYLCMIKSWERKKRDGEIGKQGPTT